MGALVIIRILICLLFPDLRVERFVLVFIVGNDHLTEDAMGSNDALLMC